MDLLGDYKVGKYTDKYDEDKKKLVMPVSLNYTVSEETFTSFTNTPWDVQSKKSILAIE